MENEVEIIEGVVKAISQENICKGCGKELLAMVWCGGKIILVCNTWWCQLFRRPTGSTNNDLPEV